MNNQPDTAIAMTIIIVSLVLVAILFIIPIIIINWTLMKKASKAGWSQLIPGYNYYVQGVVAERPTLAVWLAVLYGLGFVISFTPLSVLLGGLLSIASMVLWIIMIISLAKHYNAGIGTWLLFILVPVVGVFFVKNIKYLGNTTIISNGSSAILQPVVARTVIAQEPQPNQFPPTTPVPPSV